MCIQRLDRWTRASDPVELECWESLRSSARAVFDQAPNHLFIPTNILVCFLAVRLLKYTAWIFQTTTTTKMLAKCDGPHL